MLGYSGFSRDYTEIPVMKDGGNKLHRLSRRIVY